MSMGHLCENHAGEGGAMNERGHCPEACCRITAIDVAYWFAMLAVWPPRLCPLAAIRRCITSGRPLS